MLLFLRLIVLLWIRFFVEAGTPQSTFTGSQQRSGVPILAFAAKGLFGVGRRRPTRPPTPTPTAAAARRRARSSRTAAPRRVGTPPAAGHDGADEARAGQPDAVAFEVDPEDEADLPRNFTFDWNAYHAAFGTKPIQDAVTDMFAEYAVLYGRIAGWVTSSTSAAMNLDEATNVARHAEHFIINLVTPILGVVHTPKVHKLLRHVLDAIKLHGNLQNANTSANEAQHKEDKVFYRRTNKTVANFTQQIVRQAQGSREIIRRIKSIDGHAVRSSPDAVPPERYARVDGAARRTGADAAADGDAAGSSITVVRRRVRAYPQQTVEELSRRPGLANLGVLLGQPSSRKLRVQVGLQIAARLDCGSRLAQTVRATPSFMSKPWYDAVLVDPEVAPSTSDNPSHAARGVLVGELLLLFRKVGEAMAVIRYWEPVAPSPGCPLAIRKCTRLRWALLVAGGGDWVVEVIPASRIRRLVHVVPDFDDLAKRRGFDAVPAARNAPVQEQRAMRFFINAFFPWA